jgi:hypothetical protein
VAALRATLYDNRCVPLAAEFQLDFGAAQTIYAAARYPLSIIPD